MLSRGCCRISNSQTPY